MDVWSLGVVFFHVLTGRPTPYADATTVGSGAGAGHPSAQLEENARILDGAFDLTPLKRCGLPPAVAWCAEDLLARMLSLEPSDRPSVVQLMRHPLWWTPQDLMESAKTLNDRRCDCLPIGRT